MPGLLIVNADDFGGNRLATDRILECVAAGGVTSTTAMVHMRDSERAAALEREHGLPVGLHLNVTQEYDDPAAPTAARERQARLARYFAGSRRRRLTFNPAVHGAVRRCVADQLDCFHELYGRAPTHIDGHKHGHLSPTVLFALPRGARVRSGQSATGRGLHASLSAARHTLIAHRHITTDYFFAVDRLGATPAQAEIDRLLALARTASVEIMVHPDRDGDHRLLTSEAWLDALRSLTVGSFADLSPASVRASA